MMVGSGSYHCEKSPIRKVRVSDYARKRIVFGGIGLAARSPIPFAVVFLAVILTFSCVRRARIEAVAQVPK